MRKEDSMSKQPDPDRVHVVILAEAAAQLDRLVADALASGRRPAGRRPNRGSVIEELIAAATGSKAVQ